MLNAFAVGPPVKDLTCSATESNPVGRTPKLLVASMVIFLARITLVNINSQTVQVLGFILLGRMPKARNGIESTPRSGTGTCTPASADLSKNGSTYSQAATTFPVLIGTMLRSISLMEAAADECYELSGDTEGLMRCANLLPYVMHTFSQVSTSELARL